jgi:MFS family permease
LRSPSAAIAGLSYGAIEICLGSFITIYAVRLGSPETAATLLLTAWGLGTMILQPLIGWLSDRIDRRWVLVLCGVVVVTGASTIALVPPAGPGALVIVFIWGGFIAGLYTVGLAHLGSNFKGSDLAAANSAFSILYAVGTIAGPGIGGLAIDAWRPYGVLVATGVIAGILIVVVAGRILASPKPVRTGRAA